MLADAALDLPPCPADAALTLARDLGLSLPVAQVLVRRGLADVEAARAWLNADERHPAAAFAGIDAAVQPVLDACRRGARITVHGDYDVDGVASTAILVRALRSIGGDIDWFLPSRTEDGYGLAAATVRRLAERGTELLLLTDCGITAVDEVALARELGLEVVVVDHHRPRPDGVLPDAPIVHPQLGGYPCPDLCAAGVAYKFAGALLVAAGHEAEITDTDLDLVGLATVADCVPLTGENRRLVRAGLRALARTEKPGLRALMAVCDVDPGRLTERELGFRLAPRLNAAGRVARADAALELLLTHDAERAHAIAAELDQVNARRRFEETRILHEAEAQLAALGEQPAYVLWGDGWHAGVIGIVASRLAERHYRPVIVVGVTGETGTGSGRSIPGFDLHAALTAAAPALLRFGGHRAAAGCTVEVSRLPELRERFVAHAAATLRPEDLVPRERVDAVVGGDELTFALAEELQRLAPFGAGNPGVSLLIPAARLVGARTIGDGRHLRFTVESGGTRAQAVAFGTASLPDEAADGRITATFRFELNEFRGAVAPQLVLRRLIATAFGPVRLVGEPEPGSAAWSAAVIATARAHVPQLTAVGGGAGATTVDAAPGSGSRSSVTAPRAANAHRIRDRRGTGTAGTIGSLVGGGERVLVVCADAIARRDQFRDRIGGFELCSWDALAAEPTLAAAADHLVALDPPLDAAQQSLLDQLAAGVHTHLAWGEAELRSSRDVVDLDLPHRTRLAEAYRRLRDGAAIADVFAGLPARRGGTLLAVLCELELVQLAADGTVSVPAVERVELELSAVLRDAAHAHEERSRWLSTITTTTAVTAARAA